MPEMCCWPAKTRKNLEVFEMHACHYLVLKYDSDINEENWLQLLFYLIVLMGIVASVIRMGLFQLRFRF